MKAVLIALGAVLILAGGFFAYRYTKLQGMIAEDKDSVSDSREAFEEACPRADLAEVLASSVSSRCKDAASRLHSDKETLEHHTSHQTPMLGGSSAAILIGAALAAAGAKKKKAA